MFLASEINCISAKPEVSMGTEIAARSAVIASRTLSSISEKPLAFLFMSILFIVNP